MISNPLEPQRYPHDLNIEHRVLGAMLLADVGAVDLACEWLRSWDFWSPASQIVFRAMQSLRLADAPLDIDLIRDRVLADPEWSVAYSHDVGVALIEIQEATPTGANLKWYAEALRALSLRRRVIMDAENETNAALDRSISVAPYASRYDVALVFGVAVGGA